MVKSKEYADWEQEKLTKYQQSVMRNKYEALEVTSYVCYALSAALAGIMFIQFALMVPWITSPYGAFIHLLLPH